MIAAVFYCVILAIVLTLCYKTPVVLQLIFLLLIYNGGSIWLYGVQGHLFLYCSLCLSVLIVLYFYHLLFIMNIVQIHTHKLAIKYCLYGRVAENKMIYERVGKGKIEPDRYLASKVIVVLLSSGRTGASFQDDCGKPPLTVSAVIFTCDEVFLRLWSRSWNTVDSGGLGERSDADERGGRQY